MTELLYRPNAGIMLINREGLVFVGRRHKGDAEPHHRGGGSAGGNWQMPQGGIDAGEAPEAAARRELFEETNVSSVDLIGEAPQWLSYDLPAEALKKSWAGRYRGQTQKWFAYRFTGPEQEIDVLAPGGGRHKAEFDAWKWIPISEVPGLIVPFKRAVYDEICRLFAPYAVPD